MRTPDPLPLDSRIAPPIAVATPAGLRRVGQHNPASGWDSNLVVPVRECDRWSPHSCSSVLLAVRCLMGIRHPLAAGFGGVRKITLVSTRKLLRFDRRGLSLRDRAARGGP